MKQSLRNTLRIAAVSVAASVALTACGSSSDSEGSSSSGSDSAGGVVANNPKLADKKIGYLITSGTSEIQVLWAKNTGAAAKRLGWTTVTKDGKGTPQGFQQGMDELISQKVDAIIMTAIEPQIIATQLKAAKAANIPVIAATVPVAGGDDPLLTANYVDNSEETGKAVADYVLKQNPKAKVVMQNVSPVYTVDVVAKSSKAALEAGGATILAESDNDLANLPASYAKTTNSLLTGNPDADFILPSVDFGPAVTVPTIQQLKSKVQLVGPYDDATSLKYIKSGANVAVIAVDTERTNLQALDNLAAFWANGTAIPRTVEGDKQKIEVITKDNVPEEQAYPFNDLLKPFTDKWAAGKFGTSTS